MIITLVLVGLILVIGLASLFIHMLRHPSPERRQRHIMAAEFDAEARVDALTRATIQAMRDAVRTEMRRERGGPQ